MSLWIPEAEVGVSLWIPEAEVGVSLWSSVFIPENSYGDASAPALMLESGFHLVLENNLFLILE